MPIISHSQYNNAASSIVNDILEVYYEQGRIQNSVEARQLTVQAMRIAFDSLDTVFGLKPGSSRVSVLENDISGQNAGKGTVEIAGSGTQFTAGR